MGCKKILLLISLLGVRSAFANEITEKIAERWLKAGDYQGVSTDGKPCMVAANLNSITPNITVVENRDAEIKKDTIGLIENDEVQGMQMNSTEQILSLKVKTAKEFLELKMEWFGKDELFVRISHVNCLIKTKKPFSGAGL